MAFVEMCITVCLLFFGFCFFTVHDHSIEVSVIFDIMDYGGFQKLPVGNDFSDKFVLFSILSQINFLLYCVDRWIRRGIQQNVETQ